MVLLTDMEKRKLEVIQKVMAGQITSSDAGRVLGLTERQIYRIQARIWKEGVDGVIHKNRGNEYAVKWSKKAKKRLVELIRQKYPDINDTHLRELLKERDKITVGRETLRRLMREAGLKPKIRRRKTRYRSRRERKEAFGMMIQIDASFHDWLEGHGPWMTLIGGIDDATGFVWARFDETENTWGYIRLLESIVLSQGIPLSLYSDRHTIFHSPKEPTVIEQIQNIRPLTQFGRAMEELGVKMIKAYSAPAKGRIERLWRTLQDRLVVEMRLAGIKTAEEAKRFLPEFLIRFNRRFCVPPKQRQSVFREKPPLPQLQRILCFKETRVVNKDHTISFEGLTLQIPPSSRWAAIARQRVTVLQLANNTIEVWYKTKKVLTLTENQIQNLIRYYKNKLKELPHAA